MKFGKTGYRGLRLHSAIGDACVVCNRMILDDKRGTSCTLKAIAEISGDSWIWRSCSDKSKAASYLPSSDVSTN